MGLCIRLLLFLLLAAQCVETNPGPTTKGRGDTSRDRRGTVRSLRAYYQIVSLIGVNIII